MTELITPYVAVFSLAYLLGSIPFGLLLTKYAGLGDIRSIGSGNIGATNVLRTGKKSLALLTLLLDGGKGAVAVLLATHFMQGMEQLAALAALLGHLFPIWLRFKGGKGVATSMGVLLAVALPVGIFALIVWVLVAALFRYSSLGALVALGTAPVVAMFSGHDEIMGLTIVIAALVSYKHATNIRRLLNHTEPQIGQGNHASPPLSPSERSNWLRLSRTENIGPITFRQLIARFGTATKALAGLPDLVRRGSKRTFAPPPLAMIEDEIAALEKLGGGFIAYGEPDYPVSLAAIEDAPPVIAVLGQPSWLSKRCIGIVGARNASLNGRKMAERLAQELGQQELVIVSGLARGIDTAAHASALNTGTVAVLAGGVDVVYPEENKALYEKITSFGAVISDQPIGCEPRAQLFPKRNRLISGLSLGVIVVEAAKQSGSLITARMALEQGREIFAVPGSPLDPRARGTNDLIREGAILTEGAEDVLKHIHALPQQSRAPLLTFMEETVDSPIGESEIEAARAKILENLSPSPVLVDELVRQCQLSPSLVMTVLLEFELSGMLERQPGHQVALVA